MSGFAGTDLKFPFFLAPMVGLSHVGLKALLAQYVPQEVDFLYPTEMINSRRLPNERWTELFELQRGDFEKRTIVQLLANEPKWLIQSLHILEQWGAWAIDINMGCPVTKALKHNYGVALMGDPEYAWQVVRWARNATNKPLSVKTRSGFVKDPKFLIRFISGLFESGANWVVLHPRLAHEKRRFQADWSEVAFVKKTLKMPIVGNGDVQTLDDVKAFFEMTQCDGVMVGRALCARPWLVGQVAAWMGFSTPKEIPLGDPIWEAQEYLRNAVYFLQTLEKFHLPKELILRKFRFFIRMSHMWIDFGHELVSKAHSLNQIEDLKDYFHNESLTTRYKMLPKTELRL